MGLNHIDGPNIRGIETEFIPWCDSSLGPADFGPCDDAAVYRYKRGVLKIAALSSSIFWLVLASLALFIALPLLLKRV